MININLLQSCILSWSCFSWDPDVPVLFAVHILVVVVWNILTTRCYFCPVPNKFLYSWYSTCKVLKDIRWSVRNCCGPEIVGVVGCFGWSKRISHRQTYGPEIVGSWCAVISKVRAVDLQLYVPEHMLITSKNKNKINKKNTVMIKSLILAVGYTGVKK